MGISRRPSACPYARTLLTKKSDKELLNLNSAKLDELESAGVIRPLLEQTTAS